MQFVKSLRLNLCLYYCDSAGIIPQNLCSGLLGHLAAIVSVMNASLKPLVGHVFVFLLMLLYW